MADRKREKTKKPLTLVISGDATVGAARKLKAELGKALRAAANLHVELEQISRIDVSFLQLLCSAHRTAADGGKVLTIVGVEREPVAGLLRQAGFLRHIGCHESTRRSCLWFEPNNPGGAPNHE
jgi:ABC-type transporter Mla MlaB component